MRPRTASGCDEVVSGLVGTAYAPNVPDRSLPRPVELESLAWSIVDAAPDAIVIVDSEGLIRVANDQTEVLFGWDREDLIGKEIAMLIPADLRGGHVARRAEYCRAPATRPMAAA